MTKIKPVMAPSPPTPKMARDMVSWHLREAWRWQVFFEDGAFPDPAPVVPKAKRKVKK